MPSKPYTVELTRTASKQLAKLAKTIRNRIATALNRLAADPRGQQPQVKALKGDEPGDYRLRVGDYRVVYDLDDGRLIVWVVEIGHRGQIYR